MVPLSISSSMRLSERIMNDSGLFYRDICAGKITGNFGNMPIFFQQDLDIDTRLGVWKIEEDEAFFLREVMPQRNVSHPLKKNKHLAGRYLLKYLFPDFPTELIKVAD